MIRMRVTTLLVFDRTNCHVLSPKHLHLLQSSSVLNLLGLMPSIGSHSGTLFKPALRFQFLIVPNFCSQALASSTGCVLCGHLCGDSRYSFLTLSDPPSHTCSKWPFTCFTTLLCSSQYLLPHHRCKVQCFLQSGLQNYHWYDPFLRID